MIRLGVWHIPYSFKDFLGCLLVSAQNTEHEAPSYFISHAIDRLLSYYWQKPILKILGLPMRGSNPGPTEHQAGILPLNHSEKKVQAKVWDYFSNKKSLETAYLGSTSNLNTWNPSPELCTISELGWNTAIRWTCLASYNNWYDSSQQLCNGRGNCEFAVVKL